jgi:hypothetical protein
MKQDSHAIAAILLLLFIPVQLYAQDDSAALAERLMTHQLEAVKQGDLQAFTENGNQAFKAFTDKYTFESLTTQRQSYLAKGYRLVYLGTIKRLGMHEHLWVVQITDYKYQLLGSLSLSHGKVVGFDLH